MLASCPSQDNYLYGFIHIHAVSMTIDHSGAGGNAAYNATCKAIGMKSLKPVRRDALANAGSIEELQMLNDNVSVASLNGITFIRHANKDGSAGGFVGQGAEVSDDAYIGKYAVILPGARIYGGRVAGKAVLGYGDLMIGGIWEDKAKRLV